MQPSDHEAPEMTEDLAPVRPARLRLSTTARIEMPRRVRYSRNRSATATRRAITTVMMRCQVATTSPRCTPLVPSKKWGTLRGDLGVQIVRVMPMKVSIRPTVTMSCTTSAASRSRRMITRSRAIPIAGAMMSRVMAIESRVGSPHFTVSCQ